MIKLGVSSCLFHPDPSRSTFGPKTLCYLENEMAQYLTRDNVLPVLIPYFKGEALENFLDRLDGFVFQGGVDMDPRSYGHEYLDKEKWPGDKARDEYELAILDYAVKHKKPVFGICRGAQLINVYFGGTLYQDISSEIETDLQHRCKDLYDGLIHDVNFVEGGLLHALYADEASIKINSIHHQSIRELGENLVVEAYSKDDDLIEAFCFNDLNAHFILAVQWHPEFYNETLISSTKLYNCFLDQFG